MLLVFMLLNFNYYINLYYYFNFFNVKLSQKKYTI